MTDNYYRKLGSYLRALRKDRYPNDTQTDFAYRIQVSKSTYIKMEKGDLSVSLNNYAEAARLLGVDEQIINIFKMPEKSSLERLGHV